MSADVNDGLAPGVEAVTSGAGSKEAPQTRGYRIIALVVASALFMQQLDGTVLTERVVEHDPPVRHGYTLSGFRPPMAWLVSQGEAMWSLAGHEFGCRVRWDYEFTLAKRWLAPVAVVVLHLFMRRAMHRCLKNMARSLEAPLEAAP